MGVERLRETLREARAALDAGQNTLHITSRPRAMRAIGLRGRVICEHHDGRKTYQVSAARVCEVISQILVDLNAI
jgi:hypothetical protein